MSATTQILCDACGEDLTYTGNSMDYNLLLASQSKAHYPGSYVVTDMAIPNPMPKAKHFCDLRCLKAWLDR